MLQVAEGLGKACAPSAPTGGCWGCSALCKAAGPTWQFTEQTPPLHWAAKVSLRTVLAWISKNWEYSFCQGSEVVALYLNQGFHRILFWTILKQRSDGGEGGCQWCCLRLKEGGGIQNKYMERFPHINPIRSQHRRYSNADGNCTKPHPSGTAEEVWDSWRALLTCTFVRVNPAKLRCVLHCCRKFPSVLRTSLENSCPFKTFWETLWADEGREWLHQP